MTLEQIEADLDEYCDYDVVGSATRAGLYIVAARRWLQQTAESASNAGSSMSMGKAHVESMLKRAEEYLAANKSRANGSSSRVNFLGVGSSFR